MQDVSITLPSEREEYGEHLGEFEKWLAEVQRAHGFGGDPLTSLEHNILRAYISWLRDHRPRRP